MAQIPREPSLVAQAAGLPVLVAVPGHHDLDILAADVDSDELATMLSPSARPPGNLAAGNQNRNFRRDN
jgi:hypothetical protein